MVNASLNWASIVGIVLAVGGAFLYFMRNFKPALARDYDVFFAAVGLLCGGILFFQGWRLDPILQFGQFLLAGSAVFFAYESVRLRGVTTEQARRSSYFEEEEPPPFRPRGGLGGGQDWDRERLEQPEPIRRRIRSREEEEDEFYRPRRSSRAAIPERAASRREDNRDDRRDDGDDWDSPSRTGAAGPGPAGPTPGLGRSGPAMGRGGDWSDPGGSGERSLGPRYSAGGSRPSTPPFGARRRERDNEPEIRRGSRPTAAASRRPGDSSGLSRSEGSSEVRGDRAAGIPQGSPIRLDRASGGNAVSDADFAPLESSDPRPSSAARPTPTPGAIAPSTGRAASASGRDNSSCFDD